MVNQKYLDKAETLIEALPYIQRFNRKIVVVKYGGSAMLDEELKANVIKDVVLLKLIGFKPIIVHGGGKEISRWVNKVGMEPRFVTNFDSYNINADDAACAIAEAVHAEKLVFLSDIEGVYKDKDDPGSLISELHVHEAEKLISEGYVGGGMIPKLQNCIDAIEEGVNRVHILDGRIPHSLLLEIFTNKGIGTAILREDGEKYYNEHE